jgi:uncharacterized protein YjiK
MNTRRTLGILALAALLTLTIAGTKISQLPRTTTISSNDLFNVVRTTGSKRTNFQVQAHDIARGLGPWITNSGSGGGGGDVSTAQFLYVSNQVQVVSNTMVANDTTSSNGAISAIAGTLKRYATNIDWLPSIYTNVIYVNATNGGTASLFAAKQAAIAAGASTIIVGPGTYTNGVTNLFWNGDWVFVGTPTLKLIDDPQNTTGAGMFDDRFSGSVTCNVSGSVRLIYNSGTNVYVDPDCLTGYNTNAVAPIVVTNGSLVKWDAVTECLMAGHTIAPYVLYLQQVGNGSVFRTFSSSPLYTSEVFVTTNCPASPGDPISIGFPVYSFLNWGAGNVIVEYDILTGLSPYTLNAYSPPGDTTELYMRGKFSDAKIYIVGHNSPQWKVWSEFDEIQSAVGGVTGVIDCFDSGRHYFYGKKVTERTTGSAISVAVPPSSGESNLVVWLDIEKVASSNTFVRASHGEIRGRIGHMEQSGPASGGSGIMATNAGKIFLSGESIAHALTGVSAGGDGVVELTGFTIQTTNRDPVHVSAGADVSLNAVRLLTVNGTNAIRSPSAMSVKLNAVSMNKPLHTNVTASTDTVLTSGSVQVSSLTNSGPTVGTAFLGNRFIETNGFNYSQKHGWLSTNTQWRLVKSGVLTNVVDVSAAAYYPSNNTFFTVHNNNNGRITEWTLDGVFVRKLDWGASTVSDAESIIYMGGNTFAEVEEDANRIFIFSITNNASGTTISTNDSRIIQLHSSIAVDGASSGVEGIAWDWDRNGWWVAHEKNPAQLLFVSADGQTTNNWFTTAQMQTFTNANQTDFSDLFLDRENQVLWVAQDEGAAVQTDRIIGISLITSNVIATISCTNFGQLEGVSVTPDGYVIAAGEANQFAIFEPVIGGLNSGISWERNIPSTNSPSVPRFPSAISFGSWGVWVTNWFGTNITLDFPVIDPQTETNLQFSLTGAAAGHDVIVTPATYQPGVSYSGQSSNGVIYVRGHNYSTTTKDPASQAFKVTVTGTR